MLEVKLQGSGYKIGWQKECHWGIRGYGGIGNLIKVITKIGIKLRDIFLNKMYLL